MKNIILEDNALDDLQHYFPDKVTGVCGKSGSNEKLIASVLEGVLVELEFWEMPNDQWMFSHDAKEGMVSEVLKLTGKIQ